MFMTFPEFATIDLWTLWGFLSQAVFFSSIILQWYASEKSKKSVVPRFYWYLRFLGSLMLLAYVFQKKDIVFFVSIFLQLFVYIRNIRLYKKNDE